MTASAAPIPSTAPPIAARPRPRVRRLPAAALGLAGLGLGYAIVAGAGSSQIPLALLLAVAAVLLLVELGRRIVTASRAGAWSLVLLTALALAVVAAGAAVVGALLTPTYGWAAFLALIGWALVLAALPALTAGGASPWQTLATGATWRSGERRDGLVRLLSGVLLLLLAAFLAVEGLSEVQTFHPLRASAVLVAAILGAVASGWVVRSHLGDDRPTRSPAGTIQRDEQVVAAHLHDSVLQTLSLIQRNATDPAKVSQLARQQERSLRDWLAGRDDTSSTTLAGALRRAAQEVEDEQPGAVIEVVAVGDAPLDREADAMVRAAREAMRNAARHAGSPVRVFFEVEDGVRELFVRDTGAGFDLAQVGEERRGVRDAIIGRMEHVGGTATIDSGASGTEIALRLPAPPGVRP